MNFNQNLLNSSLAMTKALRIYTVKVFHLQNADILEKLCK